MPDPAPPPEDVWRETVRDIYDECHFDPHGNVFYGRSPVGRLAQRIVDIIEQRHPEFFTSRNASVSGRNA